MSVNAEKEYVINKIVTIHLRNGESVPESTIAQLRKLDLDKLNDLETKERLVAEIVNKWLPDAPMNLRLPQRKELKMFDIPFLEELACIDPKKGLRFPQTEVVPYGWEAVILRLAKRMKVAEAIKMAEHEGLFEVAEHVSGSMV